MGCRCLIFFKHWPSVLTFAFGLSLFIKLGIILVNRANLVCFTPNIHAPEGRHSAKGLIWMRDKDGKLLALIPTKLTNTGRYLSRRSHPFRSAICIKSPVLLIPSSHIDPSNCPPCVCLRLVPGRISVPGACWCPCAAAWSQFKR